MGAQCGIELLLILFAVFEVLGVITTYVLFIKLYLFLLLKMHTVDILLKLAINYASSFKLCVCLKYSYKLGRSFKCPD